MNNETKDEVVYLYLDDIIPNRFQPREVFDEKALKELAVSIKEHGVIQPIIVRNANGKYEIIAGERRYKASALAGLTKIPAIIRDLDDKESSKVALLENLQRKNLSPIEEARTYQKILELDQMTQDELAKSMGKSQSAIANKLRLLALPDEVQDAILKEQISERHARALLNVPEPTKQRELLKEIIDTKMSVRILEDKIKVMNGDVQEEQPSVDIPAVVAPDVSAQNFINDQPLSPTTEIKDDTTLGEIKIVPPEGEEMETPKFINFADVDNEELGDTTSEINPEAAMPSINVEDIKENATDLSQPETGTSSLDAMLNLNPTVSESAINSVSVEENSESDAFKFDAPTEEIKPAPVAPEENVENDYFQPDEEMPIPFTIDANQPYTIEEAKSKINELVEDLKKHGINITNEEMDFEKSFQVMLKIEKETKKEENSEE